MYLARITYFLKNVIFKKLNLLLKITINISKIKNDERKKNLKHEKCYEMKHLNVLNSPA